MSCRGFAWGTAGILLWSAAALIVFVLLDGRPPNDHDDHFTKEIIEVALELREAPASALPGRSLNHFLHGGDRYAPLAQVWLLAAMDIFGMNEDVYRLANLPFLLLLILGVALLARELAGPRLALLAAFIVANMPMTLHFSRKWFLHFHAATFGPLLIWLAYRCLRSSSGRSAIGWATGLALLGSLRLYTHPIGLPETFAVVLGTALLLPLAARGRGRSMFGGVATGLLIAVLFGATSAWYLGLAPGLLGEPPYSFRRYQSVRATLATAEWLAPAPLAGWLSASFEIVREWTWIHLHPPLAVLLAPGLLGLANLPREADPKARRVLLLVVLVVAPLPLVVLSVGNGAFTGDWILLAPSGVVLALIGWTRLLSPLGPRGGTLAAVGAALLVLVSAASGIAPLVWAATGEDAISRPDLYRGNYRSLFTRSSSGRALNTHLVPAPARAFPMRRVAEEVGTPTPEIGLVDLEWTPASTVFPDCDATPPADPKNWRQLGTSNTRTRGLAPTGWSFLLAGGTQPEFVSVGPDAAETPEWLIFRIWFPRGTVDGACEPSRLLPDGLVEAAVAAAAPLGKLTLVTPLPDPTGRLAGWSMPWSRDGDWAALGALVRSAGPSERLEDQAEGGLRVPVGEQGGVGRALPDEVGGHPLVDEEPPSGP